MCKIERDQIGGGITLETAEERIFLGFAMLLQNTDPAAKPTSHCQHRPWSKSL